MSNMIDRSKAYAVVIADLERQKLKIDKMIERLKGMSVHGFSPTSTKTGPSSDSNEDTESEAGGKYNPTERDFLGKTVVEAAKIVLQNRRKPMSPAEIREAVQKGGLIVSNPNTVGSVLNRRSRAVGDVVSPERGKWGLKEWYPGRSFAKNANESTEPEQPSEPRLIFPKKKDDLL